MQDGIDVIEDVIYHTKTYDVTTIRAATPMFRLSRVSSRTNGNIPSNISIIVNRILKCFASLIMAFCVNLCFYTSFSSLSHFLKTLIRKHGYCSFPLIRVVQADELGGSSQPQTNKSDASSSSSSTAQSSTSAPKTLPKKPVYSMKKGQIVRVDKEKYLSSINDWTTFMKTAVSSWICEYLKQESVHLLHGWESQQLQLGFLHTCLSSST